jgi:nucleoside-diphosphate-sugar epimerase
MTDPLQTPRTVLIVGATGSFGGHAAAALVKHGWRVRALARDPAAAARKAGPRMPIEWIEGDAMIVADVVAAAAGAQVIVHAANPPAYRNWRGLALPMMAASVAAAKAHGARLVLPGTVYNYAPDAGPRIAETAPQAPVTRKGQVRLEMEAMIQDAVRGGARGLVLRAGDFFGPAAPNSAFQWLTNRRGGRVRSVYAPGAVDVGHAFAYLPDMAEVLARLLDREAELADFERFHFAGHWLARGDDMAGAIRRVTGLRGDVPRTPGDALSVEEADRPGRHEAAGLPWRHSLDPARRRRSRDPGGHGLPWRNGVEALRTRAGGDGLNLDVAAPEA